MQSLQLEINRQLILKVGSNPRGNKEQLRNEILSQYDLSPYLIKITHDGLIQLSTPEKEIERQQQLEKEYANKAAKERFIKRVKSGQVEQSISNYINKYYPEYVVKHSRSSLKSESFYIYPVGSEFAVLKLSLHNTMNQQQTYKTPFCDLSAYTSVNDLKKYVAQFLKGNL